jgi:hypothetical protein
MAEGQDRGRISLAHLPCRNCGDAREGTFCPECGTRKVEMRASVRRLMQDVLADQFSLDGKLPQTLKALFFKPGALTLAWVEGQGRRYVHPFRLYLFSSILFFLLLGMTGTGGTFSFGTSVADDEIASQSLRAILERDLEEGEGLELRFGSGPLNQILEARTAQVMGMTPSEAGQQLASELLSRTPTLLFLLLPAFAGVFMGAYWRKRRFYVEHFICVLHLHAFVFATFSLQTLFSLMQLGWLAAPLQLWLWTYLLLTLRRVYRQGWRKTLLKFFVIAAGYFIILMAALPSLVVTSILFWG